MDLASETNFLVSTAQKPSEIDSHNLALSGKVKEAWISRCSSLGDDERKRFELHACKGLSDYLGKLEAACHEHMDRSRPSKILEWFEPLYKAVQLFTPGAAIALAAYPNPGSVVLGGIVSVLDIARRAIDYQKRTLQMLAGMGRKARIILEYEQDLYNDDDMVQEALVAVYGDILGFCQKACRFLTKNGKLRAKIKGLRLMLIRDFDHQLGQEVQSFTDHLEDLEARASLCDKRRLNQLHKRQEAYRQDFDQGRIEGRDCFMRQDELYEKLLKRQQNAMERNERRRMETERLKVLNWLSPLDFSAPYDERCDDHLEGTGAWLLHSDVYRRWKYNKKPDLLWIKGKPGCGKSILSAVAVTNLEPEKGMDTALAYAFCRRQDEYHDALNIFRALAKQICQQQSRANPELESAYSTSQQQESLSRRRIRLVTQVAMSIFSRTFVVIDALDECENHSLLAEELLHLLHSLQVSRSSILKVLVFSRHDWHLEQHFQGYSQMQPDLGANEADLKAYIRQVFNDSSQPRLSEHIQQECFNKADGMFLWVKLLGDNLRKHPLSSQQKLKRIKGFPSGLDGMYDRILGDIWKQDEDVRSTAFLVLIWATHAVRPLRRLEMLEAVAEYTGAATLEEASASQLAKPEQLVAICANLVFIDRDGCFRLCHESARSYLDRKDPDVSGPRQQYQQQKKSAQMQLAEVCVRYLLLDDFKRGPAKSLKTLASMLKIHPFLAYAATHWGSHVPQRLDPPLHQLIMDLVSSPSRRELSMQIVVHETNHDPLLWQWAGSSNPLHILAMFGLKRVAAELPDVVSLSQSADRIGWRPLYYALTGRHHEMSLWLTRKAQHADGSVCGTPLESDAVCQSAVLGWTDVLQELISRNRSLVNSMSRYHRSTGLHQACRAGKMEAAAILVDNGANVDLQDEYGCTPLMISVVNCYEHFVELLLESGADPNLPDKHGFTSLHYAARDDHAAIMISLLKRRAKLSRISTASQHTTPLHKPASHQSGDNQTIQNACSEQDTASLSAAPALHIAAHHNSPRSAEALLAHGDPKDALDHDQRSALYVATLRGASEAAMVLIKAKCDVGLASSDGTTAIHAAASNGCLSILKCIRRTLSSTEWIPLANQRSQFKETPLHCAVRHGDVEVVEFLLREGANPCVAGLCGAIALHYAAYFGHMTIARMLLGYIQDANFRDPSANTPLHFAVQAGNYDFIEQFFQDCAEMSLQVHVNTQNEFDQTPLLLSLVEGREDIAGFLLEKGSLSKPDKNKNYPIHLAAWHGFIPIVEILLNHDGVKEKGHFGRTPLFNAALRGQQQTLKLLADPSNGLLDVPDDSQATPIVAALKNCHIDLANDLLDMQADHTTRDEDQNTLLHMAVCTGNPEITERLLHLGCRDDSLNRYNETPLHTAVQAGSLEAINILATNGLNHLNIPNAIGFDCGQLAAQEGSLEILQTLVAHGAQLRSTNFHGESTAHIAARHGNWEILDFLQAQGVDLGAPDGDGNTSLIIAAREGNKKTVDYLLRARPHLVNTCNDLERASPLTKAAKTRLPITTRYLVTAGANILHRDALGMDAVHIASQHAPLLRELRGARTTPVKGLEPREQEQLSRRLIQHCCDNVLLAHDSANPADASRRWSSLMLLARALILNEDFQSAGICEMELTWPPRGPTSCMFFCDLCDTHDFAGNRYTCKQCLGDVDLCRTCYEDYSNAGRKAPEAFETIRSLERQVQRARAVIPSGLTLENVSAAMCLFYEGRHWLLAKLDEYKTWKKKNNAKIRYRHLGLPGREFLKLVKSVGGLQSDIRTHGTKNRQDDKSLSQLNRKYETLRRHHPADRETRDFICDNHEYMNISWVEREKLKSAGIELNPETGRVTRALLRSLRERYSLASGAHAKESNHPEEATTSELCDEHEATPSGVSNTMPAFASAEHIRGSAPALPLAHGNGAVTQVPGSQGAVALDENHPVVVPQVTAEMVAETTVQDFTDSPGSLQRGFTRTEAVKLATSTDGAATEADTAKWTLAFTIMEAIHPGYTENYIQAKREELDQDDEDEESNHGSGRRQARNHSGDEDSDSDSVLDDSG